MAATSIVRDHVEQSIQDYEQLFGEQHVLTLHLRLQLAGINILQHRNQDAEAEFKRVLGGLEETRGDEDKLTLEAMYHLGVFYLGENKLQQAEAVLSRCLQGRLNTLGPQHPATTTVACKLREAGGCHK